MKGALNHFESAWTQAGSGRLRQPACGEKKSPPGSGGSALLRRGWGTAWVPASADLRGPQELEGARPLGDCDAVAERQADVVLDGHRVEDVPPVRVVDVARDLTAGDLTFGLDAGDVRAEKPNLLAAGDVDEASLAASLTRVGRRGDRDQRRYRRKADAFQRSSPSSSPLSPASASAIASVTVADSILWT